MTARWLVLVSIVVLLAIFVALNWPAFTAPTTLSVIAGTVQAPLGIVMLAVTAVLALIFVAYALQIQAAAFGEMRRMRRELDRQREVADNAEASRIAELGRTIGERLEQLAEESRKQHALAAEQSDLRDQALRTAVEQAVNGLAAQIAEIDDRMRHVPEASAPPR